MSLYVSIYKHIHIYLIIVQLFLCLYKIAVICAFNFFVKYSCKYSVVHEVQC